MNIKIIDEFLSKEDFKELCNLNLKKINKNEIKVYHNKIMKNGVIQIVECIYDDLLKKLHKDYNEIALSILKELCPEKFALYEFSEFHIIETGSNYVFPIHDDTPDKLLSGVIFLKPENNNGTFFYDTKKGNNKREVEWKQNRAVFFSRKERSTWHSYEGDKNNNRIALVYNLMTSKIKEVCKIEKSNFFIANTRYKLNPYLYRLFKKTI
jgi:hypothetical protein